MRPGTPHYVVTLEDSLCVGGHFFTSTTFTKTLFACIHEHFVGTSITNTEHCEVHIVLFKIFQKWATGILSGYDAKCQAQTAPPGEISSLLLSILFLTETLLDTSSDLPPASEFASLFIFMELANSLEPASDPAPGQRIWQKSSDFKKDWEIVFDLSIALFSAWEDALLNDKATDWTKDVLRSLLRRAERVQDLWGRLSKRYSDGTNILFSDHLLRLQDPEADIHCKLERT